MRKATAVVLLACLAVAAAADQTGNGGEVPVIKRPLTVADAVGTTRAFSTYINPSMSSDGVFKVQRRHVFVSPDGTRYAAVLVRGDLKRGGNWFELIVGSLESVEKATQYQKVASLFLLSKVRGPYDDRTAYVTYSHWNRVRWSPDSRRIMFLYSPDETPAQVFAVDVQTRRVEQVTQAPRGVLNFEIGLDGSLFYTALAPHSRERSAELLRTGFTIAETSDLFNVLRGDVDGYSTADWLMNVERYALLSGQSGARKIQVNSAGIDRFWSLFETQFSPDGRFALMDGTPEDIPADWDAYSEPAFQKWIRAYREKGEREIIVRQIKGLYLVDLHDLSATKLWDAPKGVYLSKAAWSPDSREILVGPTFLPPGRTEIAGRDGSAFAVVDVRTGRFATLPVPDGVQSESVAEFRWISRQEIEMTSGAGSRVVLRRSGDQWRLTPQRTASPRAQQGETQVRVELRQDMNTPPAFHAVDTETGSSALILDLNPELRSEILLGKVEHYTWTDDEQRTWSGLLYYPVNHVAGQRYPLVIQTHGHADPGEFSLYGNDEGLGPNGLPYAAQSLAGRGIAVLQIEDKKIPEIESTLREPAMYVGAYESAIDALHLAGLVDPDQVGLSGFSATGYHIEYALIHSKVAYAAALVSDNVDYGYLQDLIFGGTANFAAMYGAEPFGEGLATWMRHAVGFNVERISTPLRLEVQSGGLVGVLKGWEIFSRLTYLKKPVEYYVIPDIEHGTHGVQNPFQCLQSQEGAVDWFDFWLNDREDQSASKREQYDRWRELRIKRDLISNERISSGMTKVQ